MAFGSLQALFELKERLPGVRTSGEAKGARCTIPRWIGHPRTFGGSCLWGFVRGAPAVACMSLRVKDALTGLCEYWWTSRKRRFEAKTGVLVSNPRH